MPYSLPLSSNPEYVALPPLGVPLTPEQDAALFAGDFVSVARRIFQGLVDEQRLTTPSPHTVQHTPTASTRLEKAVTNAP